MKKINKFVCVRFDYFEKGLCACHHKRSACVKESAINA